MTGSTNGPLNRKELGQRLGEAMNRPAGAYASRRIGDFENPGAKSPPPPEALRGYARVFGDETEPGGVEPLERELLTLRRAIEALPPDAARPGRSRKTLAALVAALMAVTGGTVAMFLSTQAEDPPAAATFCARNTENKPASGTAGVVCARDVHLRPSPTAPAAESLGTVRSGDRFTVDRYSPTGAWVHGTVRLDDGREVAGWMEAGWFCPPAGTETPATACRRT